MEAQDSSVKKKTTKKRAKAPSESQGALRRSTRSAKEVQQVSLSDLLTITPPPLLDVAGSAFSLGGSPPPRTFSTGKYLLFPLSAQVLTRLIHSASSNSAMIASTKKDVPAAHSASSGVTRDPGRMWGTYELPKVRSWCVLTETVVPPSNKAVLKKTPRVPLLPSPAHILKPQSASSPSDRRERHCLHAPNASSSVRRVATPFVAVSSAYTQASVRIVAIRSPRKTLYVRPSVFGRLLIGTSAGLNAPDASSSVRRAATLSARLTAFGAEMFLMLLIKIIGDDHSGQGEQPRPQ
ncbi:hypothetical protein GGX14DRAFT_579934 [Mycena pura]|uniref:Uncharacterized protein n=1 Tax=Mycena pura TaxID=153505 RepID=A0AAD6ULZ6_9AGAR|nr:hypothetical protein GGX14DRAFT_579934 [Mycena pura]